MSSPKKKMVADMEKETERIRIRIRKGYTNL